MFCGVAVWGAGLDAGGVVVTIAGELFSQALEIGWPIIYVIESLREGVDTCPPGLFGQEMAAV